MNLKTILSSVENGICTLTINRPEKLNALNADVFTDLETAIDQIQTDDAVKGVIITGAGPKAFVAGADISEFQGLQIHEAKALAIRGQNIFFKIENSCKPVIAAVNGFALGGGCELAMACHFRLCSTNAKFGQPEVNLGLVPGYGGTQRLTYLVGKGRSMELQMSARLVDAEEALRIGLVNYVTSAEELLPKTIEILSLILTKAPVAVAQVIKCVNAAITSDHNTANGFEQEVFAFGQCFNTQDMKEGAAAFLEKRKPVFTGK